MYIATFIHRYPPALGGAEAWFARLNRALVEQGETAHVWTTTALDLSAFWATGFPELPAGTTVQEGVAVHRFAPDCRGRAWRYVRKGLSLLPWPWLQAQVVPWSPRSGSLRRALCQAPKPDVVHASAFPYASVLEQARTHAVRSQVPFVLTPFVHLGDLHDPHNRIRRVYTAPYLRRLVRAADRVLVQTPTEGDAVAAMGVPTSRIVLQGLGVDPTECTGGQRTPTRQGWGVGDEVVVGHLANQSYEKGTIDLLQAAAELVRRGVRLRVVLAGTQMPGFQAFWDRFGPAPWVTQLGPLSDVAKRDFFAAIDVFAMPSRSDSFGLVYLEAWANRVPVVGYEAGGVADVIRNEEDGLLVRCGALDELADALHLLVRDPATRRAWGSVGHARLDRDFRWADKIAIAHQALTQW